jgi:hypothetical protein
MLKGAAASAGGAFAGWSAAFPSVANSAANVCLGFLIFNHPNMIYIYSITAASATKHSARPGTAQRIFAFRIR